MTFVAHVLFTAFVTLLTAHVKGQPTLNVTQEGQCFINDFKATVLLHMTDVNPDKWPAKLLIEEKQGARYNLFCRVAYAKGMCVTNGTACTCGESDEFAYRFSVTTPIKQNTTTYKAIVFDSEEKTSVEQTFEAPVKETTPQSGKLHAHRNIKISTYGKRKRTATLNQVKDLLKAPTWTLSLIERSHHKLTLCQENTVSPMTYLLRNDERRPFLYEDKNPCLVYPFQILVKFQKIILNFDDQCEPDGVSVTLFITALDPDNFTIPNCAACHVPPLVDWAVVAKWIMPTSILSFVSIMLIIYYLQAPPQEFQRLVERSITSVKSITRSHSNKSIKKPKEQSKTKSAQSIPKSNTSVKNEEEETGPKEPIIVYSYVGTELI